MKSVRKRIVREHDWGLYTWRMKHNGRLFADDEGNILNIPARMKDYEKIKNLIEAARYYGAPEGEPYFLPGHRQITDDEFDEQVQRMKWGLIPDPLDSGAARDEAAWRKQYDR